MLNLLSNKYRILYLILFCSALSAINFKEGNKTFPYYLWFSAGLTSLTTGGSDLIGINAAVNFSKSVHVLKFRAVCTSDYEYKPYSDNDTSDIGLLYGYRQSFGNINISYLAGAGVTFGTYKGDEYYVENDQSPRYKMIDYQTFGIPLEIQLDLNRARPFGLGLSVFSNINAEKIFAGFSLSLLLGRLP